MKKITLFFFLLSAIASSYSYAQCNTSLAGNFEQRDSCSTFSQAQYSNVSISATSPDLIHIADFGSLTPPYEAYMTVDCINHTISVPTQFAGVTQLWGSGTFNPNFNSITINWTWDYGTGQLSCKEIYTRLGSGIEEFSVAAFTMYPNPASATLTLVMTKPGNTDVIVTNTLGEIMFSAKDVNDKFYLDVKDFPAGVYSVTVTDREKRTTTKKFVKM